MNEALSRTANWHEVVLATLKSNNVKLVTYVPDKVFTPLIKALHADAFLQHLRLHARGRSRRHRDRRLDGRHARRGADANERFATIPNALASLVVPSQIPALIFVSERGTLGEFNLGQAMVCKTMRPVLDSLGIEHHTITRQDELAFIIDRSIKQAVATQAAAVFILSPLLTGGKVFEA